MRKALITLFLFSFPLAVSLVFSFLLFVPFSPQEEGVVVIIKNNQGRREVSGQLEQHGLIPRGSGIIFEGVSAFLFGRRALQTGEYRITTPMTMVQLARLFTYGVVRNEETVTIIEGWTIRDIMSFFEKNNLTAKDLFSQNLLETSLRQQQEKTYSFLADLPITQGLEGYLFPDTYRVYRENAAGDFISKALNNFDKKFSLELRAAAAAKELSIHEVVTMASIIEQEVKSDSDRALVADLFYRRLKAGMPLQSDATVNFATGKKLAQVSLQDIAVHSPYNTYKVRGLPPGPICNPGLPSLRAAVFPQANTYWYFLTDKEGGVHYGITLEDHNANRKKYLP